MNKAAAATPAPRMIHVAMIDDHTLFRESLKTILNAEPDIEVVGDAMGREDGLAMIGRTQPNVLIQDICLGPDDGIKLFREIKVASPRTRCLILTGFVENDFILRAIRQHMDGFLLKSCSAFVLTNAIRQVAAGHKAWDHAILSRLAELDPPSRQAPHVSGMKALTAGERKIAHCIAEGMTNRQIGIELHLAEKTIRNRITVIMEKLHVARRSGVAALYTRTMALSR
jgi:two-component system response regulator DevR